MARRSVDVSGRLCPEQVRCGRQLRARAVDQDMSTKSDIQGVWLLTVSGLEELVEDFAGRGWSECQRLS